MSNVIKSIFYSLLFTGLMFAGVYIGSTKTVKAICSAPEIENIEAEVKLFSLYSTTIDCK